MATTDIKDTTNDTTMARGTVLKQQEMWEVDFDKPTRVHRVVATLVYAPIATDYRAALIEDGDSDEFTDYQWETERIPDEGVEHIYEAREDGAFVECYDMRTRIFASHDEALAACIEALEKRIVKAQAALEMLTPRTHADETPLTKEQAAQADIEKNIASFLALPIEQCPWPSVRSKALALAHAGAPIYAYTHGPFPDGRVEWVIWDDTSNRGADNRYSPREWAIKWGYAVE